MTKRISWDTYFIQVARMVALRSSCDRAHVGAVLVKDRRILATGYNGSPRGMPHCDEVGHLMRDGHCVRTIHAEMNAVISAASFGVSTEGATLYVTHTPCYECAKVLINAGIKEVIYDKPYGRSPGTELLIEAGVKVTPYEPEPEAEPRESS